MLNKSKIIRLALVLLLTAVFQVVLAGFEVDFFNLVVYYIISNLMIPELEPKSNIKKELDSLEEKLNGMIKEAEDKLKEQKDEGK